VKDGKPVNDAGVVQYLEAAINEYKADKSAAAKEIAAS
jgi:hypothetical protein